MNKRESVKKVQVAETRINDKLRELDQLGFATRKYITDQVQQIKVVAFEALNRVEDLENKQL